MSTLMHLIYSSAATHAFDRDELLELLSRARLANSLVGVSGMLLYINGSFLQILEGPPDEVESLFEKISSDTRHTNLVTIISEPIAKRDFDEWNMGFADVTVEDVQKIEGLESFFETDEVLTRLDRGRTKKLLKAFRDGRWRSKIGPLGTGTGTDTDTDTVGRERSNHP